MRNCVSGISPIYADTSAESKNMFLSIALLNLEGEEKAGCFAFIALHMFCYFKCSVALPHGAVGWSAACDYGISRSYSLTFC